MKLTIIRGLPGSGKSTMAKDLDVFHVEADMYHMRGDSYEFDRDNIAKAHAFCQDAIKFACMRGVECVVSNTFTTKKEIQPYLEIAKSANYSVEIICMTENYGSVHNVPEEVMKQMKERFEFIEGELLYT